jgi:tRNA(fMet)-specific endonuclease VapC
MACPASWRISNASNRTSDRKLLEDALAPFAILPFDDSASLETAKLRAGLEKKGRGIGPYDTLIAGHALALGAILITSNAWEFSRVRGLKLENWMAR